MTIWNFIHYSFPYCILQIDNKCQLLRMNVQHCLSLNSLPEYSNIFDCAPHVGHHVGSHFFFFFKLLSCVQLFAAPWTVTCQAPLSMEFSRQEYWSGKLFPSPGDLPNPGIEPRSPALQADFLPCEPPGRP